MISYRLSKKVTFISSLDRLLMSISCCETRNRQQERGDQEQFYKSLFLGHPLFGASEPKQKHRWVEAVPGPVQLHASSVHQLSSKCCSCRMLIPKSHYSIDQVSTSAMDFQFYIWGIGVAMTNLKWGLGLVGGCGGSLFWNILSSWIL